MNEDKDKKEKYKIYTRTISSKELDIYFSEGIGESKHYVELLDTLRSCSSEDKINFYLGCPGGSVRTGQQIINAIDDCAGHVKMIVDTTCYSMASILALCGNSLDMRPNSILMFHNYTGGGHGKGNELIMDVNTHNEWCHKVLFDRCYPFLTKKEINGLKKDQDVYVNQWDGETKNRIARHFK